MIIKDHGGVDRLVEKSPHTEIIEGQKCSGTHQENNAVYGVTIQNSVKQTYIEYQWYYSCNWWNWSVI